MNNRIIIPTALAITVVTAAGVQAQVPGTSPGGRLPATRPVIIRPDGTFNFGPMGGGARMAPTNGFNTGARFTGINPTAPAVNQFNARQFGAGAQQFGGGAQQFGGGTGFNPAFTNPGAQLNARFNGGFGNARMGSNNGFGLGTSAAQNAIRDPRLNSFNSNMNARFLSSVGTGPTVVAPPRSSMLQGNVVTNTPVGQNTNPNLAARTRNMMINAQNQFVNGQFSNNLGTNQFQGTTGASGFVGNFPGAFVGGGYVDPGFGYGNTWVNGQFVGNPYYGNSGVGGGMVGVPATGVGVPTTGGVAGVPNQGVTVLATGPTIVGNPNVPQPRRIGMQMSTQVASAPGTRQSGGPRTMVAGARQEIHQERTVEQRVHPDSPEQVRLASYAEDLMEDRPFREGKVSHIGGTRLMVSYKVDGITRETSVPVAQAFFFRKNGEMQTVATAPELVQEGDRILFQEPRQEEPRQSVAGSREEVRSEESYSAPSTSTRRSTTIRSRVAGQRQTIRRRAAK